MKKAAATFGSKEWFERQYEATADDPWGLTWRPTQLFRYGFMIRELTRHPVSSPDRLRVLDIGCATGEFTFLLHNGLSTASNISVTGVDLSPTAIERAKARFRGIQFDVGSLEDCARSHLGGADIVSCLEVLYYLPAAERPHAMELLGRIVKPGGLLLISTMIGKPPYLAYEELRSLVSQRFTIAGAGRLSLWPLTSAEKLLLKVFRPSARANSAFYAPGRRGFAAVDAMARTCRTLLGSRADSHAYVLARNS